MSTQQIVRPLHVSRADVPLLRLDLAYHDRAAVITISGEMDMSTAHLLTDLVQHVARDRPVRVVLDMAKVGFFCADGLRALLRSRDIITAAAGQLLLRAPSAPTWRVLTITGTSHLFPIDVTASSR
jgi:anti-sigma B factor antagonist